MHWDPISAFGTSSNPYEREGARHRNPGGSSIEEYTTSDSDYTPNTSRRGSDDGEQCGSSPEGGLHLLGPVDILNPHCESVGYTSETTDARIREKLEREHAKYRDRGGRRTGSPFRSSERWKMAGPRKRFLGLPAWLLPSCMVLFVLPYIVFHGLGTGDHKSSSDQHQPPRSTLSGRGSALSRNSRAGRRGRRGVGRGVAPDAVQAVPSGRESHADLRAAAGLPAAAEVAAPVADELLPSTTTVKPVTTGMESSEQAIGPHHSQYPQCGCDAATMDQNLLVVLSKPWRYFSSAHWFHICEYYLPHQSRQVPLLSHTRSNATVYIQAPSVAFMEQLTKMSLFLLTLAFTNGGPARVEVVPPSAVEIDAETNIAYITPTPGTFVFDASRPVETRFYRTPASFQRPSSEAATAMTMSTAAAAAATGGGGLRGAMQSPEGFNSTRGFGASSGMHRDSGGGGGGGRVRGIGKDGGSGGGANARRRRMQAGGGVPRRRAHAAMHTDADEGGEREGYVSKDPRRVGRRERDVLEDTDEQRWVEREDGGRRDEGNEFDAGRRWAGAAQPASSSAALPPPCTCATVVGEFGGAPVERGYWFGSAKVVDETRGRIQRLCSREPNVDVDGMQRAWGAADTTADPITSKRVKFSDKVNGILSYLGFSRKSPPSKHEGGGNSAFKTGRADAQERKSRRLVIYQRNKDRMILDPDTVIMNLHERLGPKWNISMVMHREEADPCSIWASLWNVDLLLTPHGFQSILLLFMRRGSAIFEVFPHKYWKEGYRPFANEYGLWHGWSQNKRATSWYRDFVLSFISQERCMLSLDCREYARGDNVKVEDYDLNIITKLAKYTTSPEYKHEAIHGIHISSPTVLSEKRRGTIPLGGGLAIPMGGGVEEPAEFPQV